MLTLSVTCRARSAESRRLPAARPNRSPTGRSNGANHLRPTISTANRSATASLPLGRHRLRRHRPKAHRSMQVRIEQARRTQRLPVGKTQHIRIWFVRLPIRRPASPYSECLRRVLSHRSSAPMSCADWRTRERPPTTSMSKHWGRTRAQRDPHIVPPSSSSASFLASSINGRCRFRCSERIRLRTYTYGNRRHPPDHECNPKAHSSFKCDLAATFASRDEPKLTTSPQGWEVLTPPGGG